MEYESKPIKSFVTNHTDIAVSSSVFSSARVKTNGPNTPALSSQRRVNTSYEGARRNKLNMTNAFGTLNNGFAKNSCIGLADYTANQHHFGDAQGLVGGWASKY